MSLIKESYDLSGGLAYSAEVLAPSSWRVQAIPSGCPAGQRVVLELQVKGENGDFVPMADEDGRAIDVTVHGNAQTSLNVLGINAPVVRVKIAPEKNSVGLISLDSYAS